MRIATLVIGLVLVVGLFLQSVVVGGLSDAVGDEGSSSAALFALAGVLGFAAAAEFPDLGFWGGISLVLALFSFFGWRGKRKAEAREQQRDDLLLRATQTQAVTAGATSYLAQGVVPGKIPTGSGIPAAVCPSCGAANAVGARFCGSCGAALPTAAIAP